MLPQLLQNICHAIAREVLHVYIRVVRPRTGAKDAQGRCVREAPIAPEMSAGRHEWVWDRRDGAGARLVPGVYFLQLEAEGVTRNRRLVLLD
jgi:hypothetical protein